MTNDLQVSALVRKLTALLDLITQFKIKIIQLEKRNSTLLQINH